MPPRGNALLGAVIGAVSVAAVALWLRRRNRSAEAAPAKTVRVTQLWIYPVKSCGGYAVQTAKVGPFGFELDREWVIVRRSDSCMLTQRELPRMKLITARIDAEAQQLQLLLPGKENAGPTVLRIPLRDNPPSDAVLQLERWKLVGGFREVHPFDSRDAVYAALSDFLGEPVFLARAVKEQPRNPTLGPYPTKPADRILAHDFSTFHIATEEAVQWVRRAAADDTIDVDRFRPNIVLAGSKFPEEDSWKLLQLRPRKTTGAQLHFRTSKGCTRCMIPTINSDAVPHPLFEPTKTLREQHALQSPLGSGRDPKPVFGLSCFHDGDGEVAVGDTVAILERFPDHQ